MPSIALTRRDRDFLFNQLRSTIAVLDYIYRAAKEPAVPLGEEPVRYYELAATGAETPPDCPALGATYCRGSAIYVVVAGSALMPLACRWRPPLCRIPPGRGQRRA
ncbi:hypothetical protein [Streptomyces sp. CAI-155]|uniref:hypothetical protein n=1 Tax=Streptomyces sp. CAI-155 TaxID=1472660 RepID=UPI001587D389|nr:hypothetical protein [Streptomyces sp. CAI-155]NUV82747.1 hypothetical protein [Streptomyces sp. CAI-155]